VVAVKIGSQNAADVAGDAGDKDFHEYLLESFRFSACRFRRCHLLSFQSFLGNSASALSLA
jgi:hypothetical protein